MNLDGVQLMVGTRTQPSSRSRCHRFSATCIFDRKPPVDRHCVHTHVRRAAAPRRPSRRRARSAAHVRVRARRVFSGLVGRRPRHDFWLVDRGPAMQGVGAAIAAPTALALIGDTFAEGPARTRAMGIYAAMSGAGGAIGLLLGGILADFASWRWVLFVNVPIGALVVVAAPRVLKQIGTARRRTRHPRCSPRDRWHDGARLRTGERTRAGLGGPDHDHVFGRRCSCCSSRCAVVEARSDHPMLPLGCSPTATGLRATS